MFGRISERVIRVIRWALVAGWLLIIASLLFDPFTSRLTDPNATSSPFRLNRAASAPMAGDRYRCPLATAADTVDWFNLPAGTCDPRCPTVQGRCLIQRPYAMGNRLFWTMALPLVPLFLLVFGHEAWRRICPLSALAQIPRRLGIQRREKFTDPRSGRIESRVRLVKAGTFLAKYFWFVQFGLLWLGLSSRLLFINSDRTSLAVFFLSVIAIAMTVGFLFGGKTWCHYLCPISPVQKFYTEPRGLFESKAHVAPTAGPASSGPTLTQAACRSVDAEGKEHSTCVGCRTSCPDADLERHYWKDLHTTGRRFFYYGYSGLVLGFYSYYRLYAGNWEYYFSGAWTHEESQRATLLAPGWFISGHPVPVPKLLAAPTTLAIFILGAYALGRLLERAYFLWSEHAGRPLPVTELRHRVFAVFTFATFNLFYGFGGRPNIALMPPACRAIIDALFVLVSTAWLITRFTRTADEYERESIEGSLRRQLVQLRLNTPKLFHGRSLNHLRTDEVYALGRVLPEVTASQGRTAYRETLRDALASGHTQSAAARNVLRSVRQQLNVSEADHAGVLAELGMDDQNALDPAEAGIDDRRMRTDGYRKEIETMLSPFLEAGTALSEALREPSVQARVTMLQTFYSIDGSDHDDVCRSLLGSDGALIRRARDITRSLVRLGRVRAALTRVKGEPEPLARLLILSLDRRQDRLAARVAAHLAALESAQESHAIGRMLAASPPAASAVLKFGEHLHADLVDAIENTADVQDATDDAIPLRLALLEIATSWEPLARRLARALAPDLDVTGPENDDPILLARMGQLGSCPLFEHLPLEVVADLSRDSASREYAAGELVCTQGMPSDEFLLIVQGSATILIETDDGIAKKSVDAGQTIGALGAIAGTGWTDTVVAAEQGASVLCIPARAFRDLLDQNAHAATGLLRLASERLNEVRGRRTPLGIVAPGRAPAIPN